MTTTLKARPAFARADAGADRDDRGCLFLCCLFLSRYLPRSGLAAHSAGLWRQLSGPADNWTGMILRKRRRSLTAILILTFSIAAGIAMALALVPSC